MRSANFHNCGSIFGSMLHKSPVRFIASLRYQTRP
jgi:hypothetical protein